MKNRKPRARFLQIERRPPSLPSLTMRISLSSKNVRRNEPRWRRIEPAPIDENRRAAVLGGIVEQIFNEPARRLSDRGRSSKHGQPNENILATCETLQLSTSPFVNPRVAGDFTELSVTVNHLIWGSMVEAQRRAYSSNCRPLPGLAGRGRGRINARGNQTSTVNVNRTMIFNYRGPGSVSSPMINRSTERCHGQDYFVSMPRDQLAINGINRRA